LISKLFIPLTASDFIRQHIAAGSAKRFRFWLVGKSQDDLPGWPNLATAEKLATR